jgi:putative Holliday junction resolvase
MRYLGIDFGTKRVGLALSDESGTMAFPHKVIENDNSLVKNLVKLCEEEKVGEIVIGHSVDKAGKDNPVHEKVEGLILELTLEQNVPIHLVPEQYTTQAALRIQGRSAMTDASAAALILESYLTSKN